MNQLNRPYDVVIPAPELIKVQERRRSPSGFRHTVNKTRRGGQQVNVYPWSKMELGDFFIVPIGGRSRGSMRVGFHHAAARYDYEIAVTDWKMEDGSPGFRVAIIIIGVNRYKSMLDRLLDEDEKLPENKQKHAHVPRPRYSDVANRRKSRRRIVASQKRRPKSRQEPREDKPSPFWYDDEINIPTPVSGMSATPIAPPEVKLSREEVVRRALVADSLAKEIVRNAEE